MISTDWKWKTKDWIDQPLHILMGFWPSFLLGLITSSYLVSFLTGLGTLGYLINRELDQHRESGNFINLDLVFGSLGIILGNLTLILGGFHSGL